MQLPEQFNDDDVPDGIQVERTVRTLRITRHWAKAAGYVMIGWVVVWYGVVYFFSTLGHHTPGGIIGVPLAIGIAMLYAALGRLFNHTLMTVTPSQLQVQHGPLPWIGAKQFSTYDIKSVCGESKTVHAKGYNYQLRCVLVILANGKRKRALSGLELTEQQTNFIISAINNYLQTLPGR